MPTTPTNPPATTRGRTALPRHSAPNNTLNRIMSENETATSPLVTLSVAM